MTVEFTQFVVAFVLGYIAARSTGFWMQWGVRILGVLAIPLLAALFFLGSDEPELWLGLGQGIELSLKALLAGFFYLMSILPVMTFGVALGAILAIRNQVVA